MSTIETDYLVVGAGASGMAYTDTLIEQTEAEVVMVDRRHRPGGHWNDAYPFARLHQPAAWYGVASRALEAEHRVLEADRDGLATGSEVCEYYLRVLEDRFLRSGQVRFFGMTDFVGGSGDSYAVRSLISGEMSTVKVRRKLVDARYPEASIPSRHTPRFQIDEGVRLIPPNDLVELDGSATGYTVLGAGKTAMDTVLWLLEQGVPSDRIRWIRPRDAWAMDRSWFLPGDTGSPFLNMYTAFIEAATEASTARDVAMRLEQKGVFHRLDPAVEPDVFRLAILSRAEAEHLRRIERVIRLGRIIAIGTHEITLTEGSVPTDPEEVYVDCTAAGLAPSTRGPIFQSRVIDTNLTTFGITPWSAAVIAYVEATRDDDDDKNRLCPVIPFSGEIEQFPEFLTVQFQAQSQRLGEPDYTEWEDGLRLNPGNGLNARLDEGEIQATLDAALNGLRPALENLQRLIADAGDSPGYRDSTDSVTQPR